MELKPRHSDVDRRSLMGRRCADRVPCLSDSVPLSGSVPSLKHVMSLLPTTGQCHWSMLVVYRLSELRVGILLRNLIEYCFRLAENVMIQTGRKMQERGRLAVNRLHVTSPDK